MRCCWCANRSEANTAWEGDERKEGVEMARSAQARELYLCSFCSKSKNEVRRLVAGPGGVYICDECVDVCLAHLAGRTPIAAEHRSLTLADAATAGRYRCSFCGKGRYQVRQLLLGPRSARICDECVDICRGVIEDESGVRLPREQ